MTTSSHRHLQNLSSTNNNPTSPPLISNMFNVLNRFISKLDAAPIDEQLSSVSGAYGFQVLRNANQEVPLEPWFDFIIGINGRTIENPDPTLFATEVRNCAGQTISLGVFCAKVSLLQYVYLVPAVLHYASCYGREIVQSFEVSLHQYFHNSVSQSPSKFDFYINWVLTSPRARKSEKSTSPSHPALPLSASLCNGPHYLSQKTSGTSST
jgi:hypothetical protein